MPGLVPQMVALLLRESGSGLEVSTSHDGDPRLVRVGNEQSAVTCDAGRLLRALLLGPAQDDDEALRWVVEQARR